MEYLLGIVFFGLIFVCIGIVILKKEHKEKEQLKQKIEGLESRVNKSR